LNVYPESLTSLPDLDSAKAESCPAHLAFCTDCPQHTRAYVMSLQSTESHISNNTLNER